MSIKEAIELRLSCQHEVGLSIIHQTPSETLLLRPEPSKWNIFEQFVHLIRYQHLFLQRVHEILTNQNPSFDRYSAEADPDFGKWLRLNKSKLIQILTEERYGVYTQFLEFSSKDLSRTGTHPTYGQMTLLDWHEFFLLHEAHHLHEMWKMAKRLE